MSIIERLKNLKEITISYKFKLQKDPEKRAPNFSEEADELKRRNDLLSGIDEGESSGESQDKVQDYVKQVLEEAKRKEG